MAGAPPAATGPSAGPAPGPARRGLRRDLLRTAAAALLVAVLLRGSVVEPMAVGGAGMAPALLPGDVAVVSRLAYALRLPFTRVALWEWPGPRRGDVVVVRDPRRPGQRLAGRVVGLPGDVVALREQRLLVNGVAQPRTELGELAYLEPGGAGGGDGPRRDTCRRWRETLALGAVGPIALPGGAEDAGAGPDPAAAAWARAAAGGTMSHDLLQCRRVRAGRGEGPFGPVRPGHVFLLGDNRDRSDDGRADGGWEVPLADVEGRVALVGWAWGPDPATPAGRPGLRTDRLFKPVE